MTDGNVTVSDLTVGYGDRTVLALEHLEVQAGEFVSILGPSGCGKTTLLNTIAGFVHPTSGTITLDGRDITHLPPHRREMGLVFQNYALFPHMTVAKNLEYGLNVRKIQRAEKQERVAEALALVGLTEFSSRYPRQLSGGQQQRVALARALVIRPKVLLLDEPLSNLDAKLRRQMRHELRELQREVGTTMIFVTHDQSEALALSDRIALLAEGHLEQEGTPEELYRTPRTAFAADFIGAANVIAVTVVDAETVAAGGEEIPVRSGRDVGDRIFVAIRPETIMLAREPAAGTVRGEVTFVSYAGDRYDYRVRLGDGTLLSVSPAAESVHAGGALGEGDVVGVTWDAEAPIVLGDA